MRCHVLTAGTPRHILVTHRTTDGIPATRIGDVTFGVKRNPARANPRPARSNNMNPHINIVWSSPAPLPEWARAPEGTNQWVGACAEHPVDCDCTY